MTQSNKQLLYKMITNEFNDIDFKMEFIYNKADELISLAIDLGLNDLANELSDAQKTELLE